jgi:polysaccharide deacetylase 2 family uncharacterized protein YibQ
VNRDLHAPLGQNRRTAPKGGFPLRRIAVGAGWLAGLIVIGGISAYPWFFGERLPGAWMPPPQKEAAKPANPGGAPGANPGPDLNSLAKSTGQQGANVVAQTMDDGSVVTTYSPKPRDGSGPLLISNGKTQEPRLAGLPNLDLIEDTPDGKLPKVGPDGLRPFDYYARPWSGARGTRIAIVVSGLGISQTGTMRAVRDLPEEVTLAFAANGNSLSRWVPEARRNGHEVLLQVPMEPFDYPDNNPGPGTLVTSKGTVTNLANLHQDMARMDSYTGIMNYLGGKFLSDPDALQPVMRDIAGRGLMFLDDGSTAQSLSGQMAGALSMPHAFASLTLDSEVNETAILKRLDDLERMAARNGSAIGVAAGFDESISAIKKWVDEAQGRGIEIVGVSALADAPANN